MKVAILGSGARETAIAHKIASCHGWNSVIVLPGNAGTSSVSASINPEDTQALSKFCCQQHIDFIIPGGEAHLVSDVVNQVKEAGGPPVIGPDGQAAQLEGSKIWSKNFMQRHGVATGDAEWFEDIDSARKTAESRQLKSRVIKYDGLAAGKGVWICHSLQEILNALNQIEITYGQKAPLLMEEFLYGDELSLIGFTDGNSMKMLLPAQDHKQAYDGDKGPNTGGMGAYCPVSWFDEHKWKKVERDIIQPTLQGIKAEKLNYRGPVYFGLMFTSQGPRLLEYNIRFGDPEAQVLLPMLKNDLLNIYLACHNKTLHHLKLEFEAGYCLGVVLASDNYPSGSGKSLPLVPDIETDASTDIYLGCTCKDNLYSGGRLLTVSSRGSTLDEAYSRAYRTLEKLSIPGTRYRKDIGRRIMNCDNERPRGRGIDPGRPAEMRSLWRAGD